MWNAAAGGFLVDDLDRVAGGLRDDRGTDQMRQGRCLLFVQKQAPFQELVRREFLFRLSSATGRAPGCRYYEPRAPENE